MQQKNKLLSLLSLAQKAGKLKTGEEICEKALRANDAKLVIVCEDASENTKSKFNKKTFFYNIPFYTVLTKEELNKAIGRNNRVTVAITDDGFAKIIEERINAMNEIE